MYPKSFDYYRAKNVEDALSFLGSHEGAKIIAGGQSLVPMMKLRIATPACLVDISRLGELRQIREDRDATGGPVIRIGALTTHGEIEDSDTVRKKIPILSSTASNIGDEQIRNLGTIGGSVCHADPSADYFPTLLVLNASVVIRSAGGVRRTVPVGEFVVGPFQTLAQESDILEEVIVPVYAGTGKVTKFARRKADFALVCAAGILDVAERKIVRDIRLAVAPQENSAVRVLNVEKRLRNKRFEGFGDLKEEIHLGLADEKLAFPSDIHGSSWYRGQIVERILTGLLWGLFVAEVGPSGEA